MKNTLNIPHQFLRFGDYQKVSNNQKEFDSRQIKRLDVKDSVFLTFDMCPSDSLATDVIDWLVENKIPATFFVNVRWFLENKSTEDISFLKNPLFTIGGHGYDHIDPMKQSDEEQYEDIKAALEFWNDWDIKIKWYRVPHGHPTEKTFETFNQFGLSCASWSGPVFDKKIKHLHIDPNERARFFIENSLESGDIILMHANGTGINTLEILKELNAKVHSKGYTYRHLT